MKQIIKSLLILVPCVFVLIVSYFVMFQEKLIFPAPQIDNHQMIHSDFQPVIITSSGGVELKALFHKAERNEQTIVFFHGNGSTAARSQERGLKLVEAGYGVLLAEYRGYGGSSGNPHERGLYDDAWASFEFVKQNSSGDVILYGHSLGTGIAVDLATKADVKALVLESPFDSLEAVAMARFPWLPVGWMLRHRFRSDEKIASVSSPILILHGAQDNIVPLSHGEALRAVSSKGTEIIVLPDGNHNDMMEHGSVEKCLSFLKSL